MALRPLRFPRHHACNEIDATYGVHPPLYGRQRYYTACGRFVIVQGSYHEGLWSIGFSTLQLNPYSWRDWLEEQGLRFEGFQTRMGALDALESLLEHTGLMHAQVAPQSQLAISVVSC